ncbi:hypothetical protein ACWDAZ_00160 [Streptomyces sp. NPDC001215]
MTGTSGVTARAAVLADPGHGDLGGAGAGLLGDGQDGVHHGGLLLVVLGVDQTLPVGQPSLAAGAVLAGEQSAAQRSPQGPAEPEGLGHGQDLAVRGAFHQAVLELHPVHRDQPAQLGQGDGAGGAPARAAAVTLIDALLSPAD